MRFTNRTTIIWSILVVLLLALASLLWMQRTPTPLPPLPRDAAVNKKAAPAKANKKDNTDQDAAAPARAGAPSAPGMDAPIVAGNLGRITELRALEEELTLEAKIAKLKREKAEASQSPAPMPSINLPSLTPPSASAPLPTPAAPSRISSPVVLSVQGVGGQLSATVRTGSGQVVVRKGSRLGGAVVTDISRQGVTILRGGKTSALPFE